MVGREERAQGDSVAAVREGRRRGLQRYRRSDAAGHEVMVKLPIKKGVDVASKDTECGWTPLSWPTENGHETAVKLFTPIPSDS